jgi:hypothetical protein
MEHRLSTIVNDLQSGRKKPHGLEVCIGHSGVRELNIRFFQMPNFALVTELISFTDVLPELLFNTSETRCATKNCGQDCNICLEEYKCRERIRRLPCNHEYHAKCFDKWCRKSGSITCPVCRANHLSAAFLPFLNKPTCMEDYIFTTQEPVATVRLKRLNNRERAKPYEADMKNFISTWLRPPTVPDTPSTTPTPSIDTDVRTV